MDINLVSLKRTIKYYFSPKTYHNNVEVLNKWGTFIPYFITDRLHMNFSKGMVSCHAVYEDPLIYRLHRSKYKLFWTAENTHAAHSPWLKWENCWLWKNAPTLSVGFDYADHPRYVRFPYWIEAMLGPVATFEDVAKFVSTCNNSDNSSRTKDCAFICRQDYFGDRAIIADLVVQVMQMSYPSDFRHNDDDMRVKFGDDKIAYLRQFRFNLCPENSNNRGYVTEKVFEAIKAGCVPIYWGNEGYPEPDILNPKAIVYLDKDKPEEGFALLKKLYEDPKAYAEFASQPRFLPCAAEKIYGFYERLEYKLKELLEKE